MRDSSRLPIGVFFWRSRLPELRLFSFAAELASLLRSQLTWIPWFGARRGWRTKRAWITRLAALRAGLAPGVESPTSDTLLGELSNYALIVTDTYHLALLGWASGTPVVCVGDVPSQSSWDVSMGASFNWRDKRYIHYLMTDALDFYVHSHELATSTARHHRLRHIIGSLHDDVLMDWIGARLAHLAQAADKKLSQALLALADDVATT